MMRASAWRATRYEGVNGRPHVSFWNFTSIFTHALECVRSRSESSSGTELLADIDTQNARSIVIVGDVVVFVANFSGRRLTACAPSLASASDAQSA